MKDWCKRALDIGTITDGTLPDYVSFHISTEEQENPFGGNPSRKAIINIVDLKNSETLEKIINWQMQAQTEQDFINEIKAYAFDYLVRR